MEGTFLQRLHKIKKELMEAGLKSTGYNPNKDYHYFQLADFLPTLLRLEEEYGIYDSITFENDQAILRLYDATEEKVEPVIAASAPFPKNFGEEADSSSMKLLGGAVTYCRRYLYFTVFNMSVKDVTELKTDIDEPVPGGNKKNLIQPTELPFYAELGMEEKSGKKMERITSSDKSVEEIFKVMTKEEALQTEIPVGPYKGRSLGDVIYKEQRGMGFLLWLSHLDEDGLYGNRVIAAAKKLYNEPID